MDKGSNCLYTKEGRPLFSPEPNETRQRDPCCSFATMKKVASALAVSLLLLCCFDITSALRPPRLPRFPKLTNRAQNRAEWSIMGGGGGVEYSVEYYTQVVDHFSFRNESTFQQRYLIHKDYWTGAASKGPIFLYCGNEGDIEWFAANTGFLWDIAPVYGALILFPEVGRHRMLNFA